MFEPPHAARCRPEHFRALHFLKLNERQELRGLFEVLDLRVLHQLARQDADRIRRVQHGGRAERAERPDRIDPIAASDAAARRDRHRFGRARQFKHDVAFAVLPRGDRHFSTHHLESPGADFHDVAPRHQSAKAVASFAVGRRGDRRGRRCDQVDLRSDDDCPLWIPDDTGDAARLRHGRQRRQHARAHEERTDTARSSSGAMASTQIHRDVLPRPERPSRSAPRVGGRHVVIHVRRYVTGHIASIGAAANRRVPGRDASRRSSARAAGSARGRSRPARSLAASRAPSTDSGG